MGSQVALARSAVRIDVATGAAVGPSDTPGSKIAVVDIVGKGRGVVATRALRAGELIEVAPVIVVSAADKTILSATILDNYGYDWFADGTGLALALGCGSLYNHSFEPNARYRKDLDHGAIEYIALIDMPAGSEICINYNGDPTDRTPLWFDVVS